MNLTLITSTIAAAAGFALAWNLQAHQITKLTLEATHERLAQHRAAHLVKERQTDAVIQAQNAAAGRVAVMRRESAAVGTELDGLRDDLDVTRRPAGTALAACNYHAATVSQLLVESATVNRELAQACDGHASDVRTLMDAWPK